MGVTIRISSSLLTGLLLAVLLGAPFAERGFAQEEDLPREVPDPQEIPTIPSVESIFNDGLRAFEQGRYEVALRRFENILGEYEFNRRTTIALLLAGHSRFHLGRYEEARQLYDRLIELYLESRYVSEARRARDLAAEEAEASELVDRRIFTLGVVLPLGEEHRNYTRAIFNGIRLAVDEHNTDSTRSLVRMVFADTGARADRARGAVRRLVREDSADVIVGPLYSASEVIPAAEVAERHGVPMIAPMATDPAVTLQRAHVFQINPPLATRAHLLADFLLDRYSDPRVGIVAQIGTDGARMARAFQNRLLEADTLLPAGERADSVRSATAALDTSGLAESRSPTEVDTIRTDSLRIPVFRLIESSDDWYRLTAVLDPDTVRSLDALFMPVTGSDAEASADAALGSVARMIPNTAQYPRVVGNSVWAGLTSAEQGSSFRVTFDESFWEGSVTPERIRFERRYRSLAGSSPNRLGYAGYDVTRFLIDRLDAAPDRPGELSDSIRSAAPYDGIGVPIHFDGGQINRGIYILQYRGGEIVRLR